MSAIQLTAEYECLSLWGEALPYPCCRVRRFKKDHKHLKHVMILQSLSCCEVSIARALARTGWQASREAKTWLHPSLLHTVEVQVLLSLCSAKCWHLPLKYWHNSQTYGDCCRWWPEGSALRSEEGQHQSAVENWRRRFFWAGDIQPNSELGLDKCRCLDFALCL